MHSYASDKMIGSTMAYPDARPFRHRRFGQLLSTGAGMPGTVVSNQALIDGMDLIASDRAIQHSIGIRERRHVKRGNKPSVYLERAARECLVRAKVAPEKISRIIYARLTGDQAIPATSLNVLARLGVRTGIPVMDVSVACSGFVHATELALNCINAGDEYVLVLGGDRAAVDVEANVQKDTRTVFLNGDGFAAALFGVCDRQKFFGRYFYTDSSIGDFAYIPFGTETLCKAHQPGQEEFVLHMPNGPNIHQSIIDSTLIISSRLFSLCNKTVDDIDFFITSDQTAMSWKAQLQTLGIPESKSCSCFHKYGNTVAAMVPLNLNEAIVTEKLKKGMTVLLMGHGAGASGGGFIFEY
ncbi:MAG: ketoacyl-ACP synthase III [Deltaproteobacteria bacterium]|nr:ketoacyl-ACP synthase III [Deltaproteobacteria bacterium]